MQEQARLEEQRKMQEQARLEEQRKIQEQARLQEELARLEKARDIEQAKARLIEEALAKARLEEERLRREEQARIEQERLRKEEMEDNDRAFALAEHERLKKEASKNGPQVSVEDSEREEALQLLLDMGFPDRARNLEMYHLHGNNLDLIVQNLIQ